VFVDHVHFGGCPLLAFQVAHLLHRKVMRLQRISLLLCRRGASHTRLFWVWVLVLVLLPTWRCDGRHPSLLLLPGLVVATDWFQRVSLVCPARRRVKVLIVVLGACCVVLLQLVLQRRGGVLLWHLDRVLRGTERSLLVHQVLWRVAILRRKLVSLLCMLRASVVLRILVS